MKSRDGIGGRMRFGGGVRTGGIPISIDTDGTSLPDKGRSTLGEIVTGPNGETLNTRPDKFHIQITGGGTDGKYSWKRVYPGSGSDEITDAVNGEGTYDGFYAYEINGSENVADDTIVEATYSDLGPWLNFSGALGGGATLAQCTDTLNPNRFTVPIGDSLGSYEETFIPLKTVLVNMPQDSTRRTYMAIAEVECLVPPFYPGFLFTSPPEAGDEGPSSVVQDIQVDLAITWGKYSGSGDAPYDYTATYEGQIRRVINYEQDYVRWVLVVDPPMYVDVPNDRGDMRGSVTMTQVFDSVVQPMTTDGDNAVPTTGTFTAPESTIVMAWLAVRAAGQSGGPNVATYPSGGTTQVTVTQCTLRVIQIDKVAEDPESCGPIAPPTYEPPEGTYRVDITVDTDGGGGGSILGGVTMTITNSDPAVVNVTATTSKFPFVYTLYLPNDTYTVTAVNTIGGASRTVTSGSFGVSGGDVGTGQIIT